MAAVMDRIDALRREFGLSSKLGALPVTNVTELLHEASLGHSHSQAFSALGESITYGQLEQLSNHFAAFLQHHTDLNPGDRIAIQLPNLLQYPVVAFGAMKAGLVLVNTNPLYTSRELKEQLIDSGAKAIVTLSTLIPGLAEIVSETSIDYVIPTGIADLLSPLRRQLVNAALRLSGKERQASQESLIELAKHSQVDDLRRVLSSGEHLVLKEYRAGGEEVVLLQYTGGTTGKSKGAELTHNNLIANTLQSSSMFGYAGLKAGEELVIAPLPLYHVFAFVVSMVMMVHLKSHTVLVPDPRNIPSLVSVLKKHPFTVFLGLNTLFGTLLRYKHFQKVDFSKLKLTASGGMALTDTIAQQWQACTGCPITEGYGLTETSPVVAVNIPGNEVIGSIGVPVPSTEVKIATPTGMAQPVGASGELWVKGPQVMRGYWKNPDETKSCLDAEGWFRTGDIAKVTEDGRLWILDRQKDMVVVSGFNVYPNEVENVINSHPQIVECAAVGVPDEKSGEMVKLFAVRSNNELSEEDLIAWSKQQLTAYKVPKQVEFVEELPKSNIGKVLRAKLRSNSDQVE